MSGHHDRKHPHQQPPPGPPVPAAHPHHMAPAGGGPLVDEIRRAIAQGQHQRAIDLTLRRFPTLKVTAFTYNKDLTEEGRIQVRNIEIGPGAFYWPDHHASPSWLASSMYHETVHYDQRFGPKYRWGRGAGGQGGHINEAEAYKAEVDHARQYGLTPAELAEAQRRYNQELGILRPPYNVQVQRGDFSVPDIFLIPIEERAK